MKQIRLICTAVLISLSSFAYTQSLESLITAARTTSIDAYILELDRRQAQADLALRDLVRLPSLTVSNVSNIGTAEGVKMPGSIKFTEFFLTGTPSVTYNLQGDLKTELQAGFSRLSYSFDIADTSDSGWNVVPFVAVSQPLKHFFDTDNPIDDIDYSVSYLSSELAYRQGMIGIDQMVLDVVAEGLSIDKNLLTVRYQRDMLMRDHERSLSLGTYSEDSARARTVLQQADTLERRIESLERNREFVITEVQRITGLRIEEVPDIPRPNPVLDPSPLGNTTVLLRSLAVDRAQEQIVEYDRVSWDAGASLRYSPAFSDSSTTRHTIDLGLSGGYKDLLLSAELKTGFGDRTTVMGTISGSWSLDGRQHERHLTRQSLELSLQTARQRQLSAEAEYERRNMQLELSAASWNRNLAQLELREEYARLDLEEALHALQRGFGRQRAVDDARQVLEEIELDKKLLYVEGWKLQRSIESHLL